MAVVIVTADDGNTLPPDVKAADANLPARLQDTALNATYAPATGSPNYTSPATAQGIALVQALIYGA